MSLPSLKQLRSMVKQQESRVKPNQAEEDIIREYAIPERRTAAVLKGEMEDLTSQVAEYFEDNGAEDDLNVSEGSENRELDAVSPFAGTLKDWEILGKSSDSPLEEAIRTIKDQEKTLESQQITIKRLTQELETRNQCEEELREITAKYQELLRVSQEFEAKSRQLTQANRLLREHLMRLTQGKEE